MRYVAGLLIAISLSATAAAAEWQYCLAPSPQDHKLYISGVFPVALPNGSEHEFMDSLKRSRLTYENVQCPRSDDEPSALIMQQHTIGFNSKLGIQIVKFPWKPTP